MSTIDLQQEYQVLQYDVTTKLYIHFDVIPRTPK